MPAHPRWRWRSGDPAVLPAIEAMRDPGHVVHDRAARHRQLRSRRARRVCPRGAQLQRAAARIKRTGRPGRSTTRETSDARDAVLDGGAAEPGPFAMMAAADERKAPAHAITARHSQRLSGRRRGGTGYSWSMPAASAGRTRRFIWAFPPAPASSLPCRIRRTRSRRRRKAAR
jgi:hypothetical protein